MKEVDKGGVNCLKLLKVVIGWYKQETMGAFHYAKLTG